MKVFETDIVKLNDLQKRARTEAALFAASGFAVCLILFLVHKRSSTVWILPVVYAVTALTVCISLGIVLGKLGYLKQYTFFAEKAKHSALTAKLTFVKNESAVFTRNHLRFTKSVFTDDNNDTVSFCVLVPYTLDFAEGQKVTVKHADDVLIWAEATNE